MKPTLKEYLRITGQSYEVFAKKVNLTRQRIEQIVNGKDNPKFETIMKIWEAADYEFQLVSIYPGLAKMMPAIKKVAKEKVCESTGEEKE